MRSWKNKVVIISAAILFLITACFSVGAYNRHRAYDLLNEVVSLRLGAATFSDAQRLAKKYGGWPWGADSEVCSSRKCRLKFVFYNTLLNHIQNQREVSLAASLTVENGFIVSREIDYSILARTWSSQYMYVVSEDSRLNGTSATVVKRLKIDSDGRPHWVEVALYADATSELRQRAYSLNLACLARLSDCSSLASVVPVGF